MWRSQLQRNHWAFLQLNELRLRQPKNDINCNCANRACDCWRIIVFVGSRVHCAGDDRTMIQTMRNRLDCFHGGPTINGIISDCVSRPRDSQRMVEIVCDRVCVWVCVCVCCARGGHRIIETLSIVMYCTIVCCRQLNARMNDDFNDPVASKMKCARAWTMSRIPQPTREWCALSLFSNTLRTSWQNTRNWFYAICQIWSSRIGSHASRMYLALALEWERTRTEEQDGQPCAERFAMSDPNLEQLSVTWWHQKTNAVMSCQLVPFVKTCHFI